MSYNFQILSGDVSKINSHNDFATYLEANFIEIERYFSNISDEELDEIKFNIEDFLYDLLDNKLIKKQNSQIVNAFLILLAEKFIATSFIGAITIITDYLPDGATKFRLEASKLYLKVNDISKDYNNRSAGILKLLDNSANIDEYNTEAIKSLFYFLQIVINHFQRVKNEHLAKSFFSELIKHQNNYAFLEDSIVVEFFKNVQDLTLEKIDKKIRELLSSLSIHKSVCKIDKNIIQKENSQYSKTLYELPNPNFKSIRNIAYQYIQNIGDPIELYNDLQRGKKIIDDEKLLYKYLASFGDKHKAKLYSAYDKIFEKIKDEKIDVIDWGCGQGMATILLLEYAKEKNSVLDIENITLIEPSKLALSRGLLHIDVFKQKEYNINPINSDLDCLKMEDLENNSKNLTLHLFSNILDIESFSLDNEFFKKVSNSYNNDALFICVSPYINDICNNRLDLFYNHFDENFDTELISARDTDVANSTRYEKLFEVKHAREKVVREVRKKIELVQSNNQLDIIEELKKYETYLSPVLNLELLGTFINVDPEYAIFKIRKVAEVITSKIYSKYEDNTKQISFNDKIRYLSYEKKDFDKSITNYIHTLRTIGNRGVHDNQDNVIKLKVDAHLMVMALIGFITELRDKKLLD